MSPVLALGFARSWALWTLLLPFAFLLVLRLVARPPEHAIGTLELWKELAPVRPSGTRARGRLPPWAVACALALLLGALAALGPRGARASAPRSFTCVVDRSPSMALPVDGVGGETRLARALDAAEGWLRANVRRDERVRWLAPAREALELARGERPPAVWLDPEADDGAAPDWSLHDRPGTLWITDAEPPGERRHAGLFASGGSAQEGAIAADGRETVLWEGGGLRSVPEPRSGAVLVRESGPAARLPPVIERVLAAWCAAHAFELVRAPRAGLRLVVSVPEPAGPEVALELARDGWSARGEGRGTLAGGPGEDWLLGTDSSGARHAVVRARRGEIEVRLSGFSEPSGDPALFALSWARLLDRCVRLAPGVVPLAERLAAGTAVSVAPEPPPEAARGPDAGPYVDAGLALAAGLASALAWLLQRRS